MYLLTHCSPVHWIDHGVICWMQDTMTLLMHRGNSMSRASSALFAMSHASEKRRAKRQKLMLVSLNWILRLFGQNYIKTMHTTNKDALSM